MNEAIAKEYQGAKITDIRMKAPRSNPTNVSYYATIEGEDGRILVSATLDYCVQRMEEVARFEYKMKQK
jgi:hypothetical protein